MLKNGRRCLPYITPFIGADDLNLEHTAVIKQENDWWIGWIEEVPRVNSQESTRGELLETLRLTLKEALELNRQEARSPHPGSKAPAWEPALVCQAPAWRNQ